MSGDELLVLLAAMWRADRPDPGRRPARRAGAQRAARTGRRTAGRGRVFVVKGARRDAPDPPGSPPHRPRGGIGRVLRPRTSPRRRGCCRLSRWQVLTIRWLQQRSDEMLGSPARLPTRHADRRRHRVSRGGRAAHRDDRQTAEGVGDDVPGPARLEAVDRVLQQLADHDVPRGRDRCPARRLDAGGHGLRALEPYAIFRSWHRWESSASARRAGPSPWRREP